MKRVFPVLMLCIAASSASAPAGVVDRITTYPNGNTREFVSYPDGDCVERTIYSNGNTLEFTSRPDGSRTDRIVIPGEAPVSYAYRVSMKGVVPCR
ncbi:hypothetical protein [Burkholderia ubonensis]|uniref:hypothetical protein n=1 Tax=Burkholderia ubonensis TaxID=101571 RepID=UPI000A9EB4C0|nr:hypothetical protein [Burkholderia ubonensis]